MKYNTKKRICNDFSPSIAFAFVRKFWQSLREINIISSRDLLLCILGRCVHVVCVVCLCAEIGRSVVFIMRLILSSSLSPLFQVVKCFSGFEFRISETQNQRLKREQRMAGAHVFNFIVRIGMKWPFFCDVVVLILFFSLGFLWVSLHFRRHHQCRQRLKTPARPIQHASRNRRKHEERTKRKKSPFFASAALNATLFASSTLMCILVQSPSFNDVITSLVQCKCQAPHNLTTALLNANAKWAHSKRISTDSYCSAAISFFFVLPISRNLICAVCVSECVCFVFAFESLMPKSRSRKLKMDRKREREKVYFRVATANGQIIIVYYFFCSRLIWNVENQIDNGVYTTANK